MPLKAGKSGETKSENISELMRSWERTGEIGTSKPASAEKAQEQAVAIAMDKARESNHAALPAAEEIESGRVPIGGTYDADELTGARSTGPGEGIAPGTTDGKYVKSLVQYRPADSPAKCGVCRYFIAQRKCLLVEGDIDPEATCNLWQGRDAMTEGNVPSGGSYYGLNGYHTPTPNVPEPGAERQLSPERSTERRENHIRTLSETPDKRPVRPLGFGANFSSITPDRAYNEPKKGDNGARQHKARNGGYPDLSNMDSDEKALSFTNGEGLSALRRERDQGLSQVEIFVRGLPRRHGGGKEGADPGPKGQLKGLFSGELSMDDLEGPTAESLHNSMDYISRQNSLPRGLGRGSQHSQTYDQIPFGQFGVDSGKGLDNPSPRKISKKNRSFAGLKVFIENPVGSIRSGTSKDGVKWSTKMVHDYGYIKGIEGQDGDELDVFLGPDEKSSSVFIIHQCDPDTKAYDEDKTMVGWGSKSEALQAYRDNYDKDMPLLGVTEMPMEEFKKALRQSKGGVFHWKPWPRRGGNFSSGQVHPGLSRFMYEAEPNGLGSIFTGDELQIAQRRLGAQSNA